MDIQFGDEMDEIKKSLDEILRILDCSQNELDDAVQNISVFYTSLKEKDKDQAYYHLIELSKKIKSAIKKFDKTSDQYDIEVRKLLEKENPKKEE